MDHNFSKVAPRGHHFLDGIDTTGVRNICPKCHGVGEVRAEKSELQDYIAYLRNEDYSLVFLKKVVRVWRAHPYFPCNECDGEGSL